MTFDDLPMSSVVYMGRGSFRMEAIATDAELGIAQPITGVVTTPLHSKPRAASLATAPEVVTRTRTSFEWRTPEPQALFGSQDDLPLLAAPTGAQPAARRARRFVILPRAALAGLGAAVFACGLLAGGAARSITVMGPPLVAAATMERTPVAPVATAAAAPAPAPTIEITAEAPPEGEPSNAAPASVTIEVPAPVKITAHKKAAAYHEPTVHVSEPAEAVEPAEAEETPAPAKTPFKPWVDPFAQ